jgi:hypothetical protein
VGASDNNGAVNSIVPSCTSVSRRSHVISCPRSFGNDSTVRLKVDNKCLDIEDYGTQNGANVWYC